MRRTRGLCRVVLALAALLAAPATWAGTQSDLHLVQEFAIFQDSTRLLQEQREIYLQGDNVALRNPGRWLLLRADLQRAWLLDSDRVPLAELTLDQLRRALGAAWKGSMPQTGLPAIQATPETRTLAGLACRVHRVATPLMTVEVCVTRQLAVLERLHSLTRGPIDIPGVPVDFRIQVHQPGQPEYSIRQTLVKVETTPLDTALFAVPTSPGPFPKSR